MLDELYALNKNNTWSLVSRTPNMHVIGSKWVFNSKLKPHGTLERLKALLMVKEYHQLDGVDHTKTFFLAIKFGAIRLLLTVALVNN